MGDRDGLLMGRSSVSTFYLGAGHCFYGGESFPRFSYAVTFLRVDVASKVKKVVYRMSEILFAAEIAFRSLDRCVSEQELNLLKLATARVAQLSAGSPQIMRCNMLQARSLAARLAYVPHDILRDAFPPHLSHPGDGSKDSSLRDAGCSNPLIECGFDPIWNRNGADVSALADQVHHCPVPLAHLDFIQLQADKCRSAKTTTKQQGQHRVVALRSHAISTSTLEYFCTFLCAQPVAGAKPKLLDALHSADPRS